MTGSDPVRARASFLHRVREPVVVAIFVLAGIFEVLSGDPVVHASVLFAAGAVLAWDGIHRRRRVRVAVTEPAEHVGGWERPTLTAPILLLGVSCAFVVALFDRYSWPSTLGVVAPGAAGVVAAWRTPSQEDPPPNRLDPVGAAAWAGVFLALALWELAALLLQPSLTTPSEAHPTISTLMDPILATYAGRSIVLTLWLAFGWYLLGR
jgi:hypothetical protein